MIFVKALTTFYGLARFINQNIMEQKSAFNYPDYYRSLHFNFVKTHVVKPQKGQNHESTKNTKDINIEIE